jgi:2-C-methyl-D-erythritol 2,4-cyclodiphosphate synthase
MRIGIGYDIHPLVEGRRLFVGGIEIESSRGLSGHSDADVLIHALCDAMLGALNIGDLGDHFPETEEFEGISSVELLKRVSSLVDERKYSLVNADCIVHAEAPAMAPYREGMKEVLAAALGVPSDRISVKFTRGEGMGAVGRKEAIAARAIVLLSR